MARTCLNASAEIGLYDASNLDQCPWPKTEDGAYAKKCLTPLIEQGTPSYIRNVKTDLRVLVIGQVALPVTINESEYENSCVCSPYGHYISYARVSLALLPKNWFLPLLSGLLWGVGKICRRFKINKIVIVNNWFYATNLYPRLESEQIGAVVDYLQTHFPGYAIGFRSIDECTSSTCYESLQHLGFTYIASRQIFYIQPWTTTLFESRLFKSDLKLLNQSGYEIIEGTDLQERDIPRLSELYQNLYIEKFSDLNPQFTEKFIQLAWKENILQFKALRKEGRIDGIVGFMERDGKMYCPFFGYDRSLPQELALYRLLSTVLMLEADRRRLLFHQSSGASMFKKIRKAESCMEFMAVNYRHLPFTRRIPWALLHKMCNSVGIHFMKRY